MKSGTNYERTLIHLEVIWIAEQSISGAKTNKTTLLVWRLVTYECPLDDRTSKGVSTMCGA